MSYSMNGMKMEIDRISRVEKVQVQNGIAGISFQQVQFSNFASTIYGRFCEKVDVKLKYYINKLFEN